MANLTGQDSTEHAAPVQPPLGQLFLAILLATALASWVIVLLLFDQPHRQGEINMFERRSIYIAGVAMAFAVFAAWWLQRYVLDRALPIRFIYGLTMLYIGFIAFGGLFILVTNLAFIPEKFDTIRSGSLGDFYWDAIDGSYSFALFALSSLRLNLVALIVAGGIFIAVFRH